MNVRAFHGAEVRADGEGKSRQERASSGKQSELPLISSMSRCVKNAPANVLRQIESAAQALDVAMLSSGAKLAYIAACIGKSEGYVSRMRAGKKPIPDKLVPALCQATGSNLLRQFLDLQSRLDDSAQSVNARLADLLRSAA